MRRRRIGGMSVGRRLMICLAALVMCTALVGACGVFGMSVMSRTARAGEEEYRVLRSVYEVGFRAAAVRDLMATGEVADEAIRRHLFLAAREAEQLDAARGSTDARVASLCASIAARVREADRDLGSGADRAALEADANRWLADVASVARATQNRIIANRAAGAARFRTAVVVLGVMVVVTVAGAAGVGVMVHRSVMGPVRTLDGAMARMGEARFGERVPVRGDLEFARMAERFNAMAGAIERLHATMREEVESTSRRLVRSEQLASVGTLAAGLAHEINNPLAIIAGYAQRSVRRIERATDDAERGEALDHAGEALRVVAEEAFRCRDIALELMRMARPAEDGVERVEVAPVVARAVALAEKLPAAQGTPIGFKVGPDCNGVACAGRAPQLMQVMLNLITNAVEACAESGGRVDVGVERRGDAVAVEVRDTGRGMDPETVARAFDPFYTDKPRRGLEGTGLGLAVTHAIVERFGGRIDARSEGVGMGSVFTVELPVVDPTRIEATDPMEVAHA